jgi:hypothetical protein
MEAGEIVIEGFGSGNGENLNDVPIENTLQAIAICLHEINEMIKSIHDKIVYGSVPWAYE